MKIAQITGLAGPGPIAGGVWQVARLQTEGLRQAGHDVRLIGGWLGDDAPPEVEGTAAEIKSVHRPFPGAGLRGLVSMELITAVRNAVQWADVVHLHLCRDVATTVGLRFARRYQRPVVTQSHGMLRPSDRLSFRLFDRLALGGLRGVSLHLALTTSEAEDIRALTSAAADIAMIDNAVEAPAVSWIPWTEESGPTFVFASRLHARKQPDVFVQAALACLESGVRARFVVCGPDQGLQASVRELVERSRYASYFQLLGPRSRAEVADILTHGAVLVLPSRDEPYPMIVLEAASFGVPMIVTRQSGVARLLEQASGAVLIDPERRALEAAMLSIDEPTAARLSASARQAYEATWTLQRLATRLVSHYEALDVR